MADDPAQQKKPDPCSFVIFGVTGDLAHRLVIPALYNLAASDLLPDKFCLVGVARKAHVERQAARQPDEGPARVRDPPGGRRDRRSACWHASPASRPIRKTRPRSMRMSKQLDELEAARETGGNRLFYLATPPNAFRRSAASSAAPACWPRTARGGGW